MSMIDDFVDWLVGESQEGALIAMALESKWKHDARIIIERALRDGRARGLDGKELVKFVDDTYPFGPRQNHPYKCWLAVRKRMLGSLLPNGHGRPETGDVLDRDYFAKLEGPGSPAWDAMLARKREEMHAAGIPGDEWTDEAVADWRPATKEVQADG